MTNDIYMTMEYTVTLIIITRYNLVHFEGNDLVPPITISDSKHTKKPALKSLGISICPGTIMVKIRPIISE